MAAQIRPTRLEINDRFPMLGFTIRTDGTPQRAEVAIATDPGLLSAQGKARRTPSNFYSSRATGPLSIPRGEAVYGATAPAGVPATPAPYDDGFGPLHSAAATPAPATAGNDFKSSIPPAPAAQGLSRAMDVGGAGRGPDVQVSSDKVPVTPP